MAAATPMPFTFGVQARGVTFSNSGKVGLWMWMWLWLLGVRLVGTKPWRRVVSLHGQQMTLPGSPRNVGWWEAALTAAQVQRAV